MLNSLHWRYLKMDKLSRRVFVKAGSAALGAASIGWAAAVRSATASARPAPGYPAPQFVQTNGIRMGYYEKGSGLPIVFCHGFPELAYSWRYQIDAFAGAGYRVILPDQRGYGLTERPVDISSYALAELCADMAGLLDALTIDEAIFVGHDWGGGVVWMMPRLFPDRVAGVIGVNTPAFDPRPENQVDRPPSLIIPSERFYQRTFQEPGVAEAALSRDVRQTFEFLMRKGGFWNVDEFENLPEDSPERRMDLLTMLERGDFQGEMLLTEAELNYYVSSFEATGFAGGLNWYRAGLGADGAALSWDIDVPCLYVGAEHDVILPPSSSNGMERYIGDLEKYTVADSGHWTQQEQPEVFNRVALNWLERKFGRA